MNERDTTQTVLIMAPHTAVISVTKNKAGRRKAVTRITGLTRLEFDALPGRAVVIGHPDCPTCWRKNVSVHITVETQEPPLKEKTK